MEKQAKKSLGEKDRLGGARSLLKLDFLVQLHVQNITRDTYKIGFLP